MMDMHDENNESLIKIDQNQETTASVVDQSIDEWNDDNVMNDDDDDIGIIVSDQQKVMQNEDVILLDDKSNAIITNDINDNIKKVDDKNNNNNKNDIDHEVINLSTNNNNNNKSEKSIEGMITEQQVNEAAITAKKSSADVVTKPQPPSKVVSSSTPTTNLKSTTTTKSVVTTPVRNTTTTTTTTNNNNNNNNKQQYDILIGENEGLKEKVSKLKALLGRSAKAQRETKIELDTMTKKYNEIHEQNNIMKIKIEKLSNRPTHMEMLADFETNFDRALLSVGNNHNHNTHYQSGGQETASSSSMQHHSSTNMTSTTASNNNTNYKNDESFDSKNNNTSTSTTNGIVDSLLLQELNDAKQRIDKLEKLNTTLIDRTKHIESNSIQQYQRTISDQKNTIQRLELEKKMAILQYEHSIKDIQQYKSSIDEMQLEINLLTVAKQKAIDRADIHELSMNQYDNQLNTIQQLQSQMNALQEWAIASNETKTLAQERVRILEQQITAQRYNQSNQNNNNNSSSKLDMSMRNDDTIDVNTMMTPSQLQDPNNNNIEEKNYHQYNGRVVLSKHGSLVVGAGDIGYKLLQLHEDIVKTILLSERVILRWKFDLGSKKSDYSNDLDIYLSIIKGHGDNATNKSIILKRCLNTEECLICHRRIIHGAEGETDHTFAYQRSCIIVWNNTHSWIRPKTIKYTLDVMVC